MLLAALAGYALCVWQALCVNPLWPRLTPPVRPDLLDLAGPALIPSQARRLTLDMLSRAPIESGEVRQSIDYTKARRSIEPDVLSTEDPDAMPLLAEYSLRGKSRAVLAPTPTYTMACFIAQPAPGARPRHTAPPGHLAARFESGPEGVAAVGHTPTAGTSYGTFQIASGTPTYANFIRYLKRTAPDLAARLSGKGPADTGGAEGAVPREWRRIATDDPRRFERLQYEFILATHYRPAVAEIFRQTGVDVSALSPASREVLWSTAVQHGAGGAADIFEAAIDAIKPRIVEERRVALFEKALIQEVYKRRLACWGQSPLVGRAAMTSRYGRELSLALALLDRHYSGT